jgi:hypothetical protein
MARYTLHGLRATGPVVLKLLGFENRAIRALTGHTTDAKLEVYLRGVDHYPLAYQALEVLGERFGGILEEVRLGQMNGSSPASRAGRRRRSVRPANRLQQVNKNRTKIEKNCNFIGVPNGRQMPASPYLRLKH